MVKVKTVVLSGTEQEVSGLGKNNALVINNSAEPVYASDSPNVVAYADGVIEIPVGACDTVVGTNGTVYLLGTGRVEVRGVDYVGFKKPSSSTSGGGSTSGVSQSYVDAQDTTTLASAKTYTDTKTSDLDDRITENTDAISTLNGTGEGSVKKAVSDGIAKVVADAPESLDTLKEISDWITDHSDSAAEMNSKIEDNASDIAELQTGKADKSEIPTSLPADGGDADTVNGHTVNADVPANAKFTDTIVDISGKMDEKNPQGWGLFGLNDKDGDVTIEMNADKLLFTMTDHDDSNDMIVLDADKRSISVGEMTASRATESIIVGYDVNIANRPNCLLSVGFAPRTDGPYTDTATNGSGSIMIGDSNTIGTNTQVSQLDVTIGAHNAASGYFAKAFGQGNVATHGATVFGRFSMGTGFDPNKCGAFVAGAGLDMGTKAGSTAFGVCNKRASNYTDEYFVIGNGTLATDPVDLFGSGFDDSHSVDETVNAINAVRNGSTLSNCFRVTQAGKVYAGNTTISSGADYAEYIKPWFDGNSENEDRRGYFVTIKEGYLYKAEPTDYIVGITSGNPSIIGNGDEDWLGRWERDEFNELIFEDVEVPDYDYVDVMVDGKTTQKRVQNGSHVEKRMVEVSNYDKTKAYVERKDRPEWSCVGMIGVIRLRDDGTCVSGGFAKCGVGGVATKADEWECHKTFFVIERINDHVISVEMR